MLCVALTQLDHSPQKGRLSVGRSGALARRRPPSRGSRHSSSAESVVSLTKEECEADLVVPRVVNIEIKLSDDESERKTHDKKSETSTDSCHSPLLRVIRQESWSQDRVGDHRVFNFDFKVPAVDLRTTFDNEASENNGEQPDNYKLLTERCSKYKEANTTSRSNDKYSRRSKSTSQLLARAKPSKYQDLQREIDHVIQSTKNLRRSSLTHLSSDTSSTYGDRWHDFERRSSSYIEHEAQESKSFRSDTESSEPDVRISDRESICDGGDVQRRTVITIKGSTKSHSATSLENSESPNWVRDLKLRRSLRDSKNRKVPSEVGSDLDGGINVSIGSGSPSPRCESVSRMFVRNSDSDNRPNRASAFNVRRTIEKRQVEQERRERKQLRLQLREQLRSRSEDRPRKDSVSSYGSSSQISQSSLRSKSMSSLDQDTDDFRSESPLFKVQSSPTLESEKEGIRTYLFGTNLTESPSSSRVMPPSHDSNTASTIKENVSSITKEEHLKSASTYDWSHSCDSINSAREGKSEVSSHKSVSKSVDSVATAEARLRRSSAKENNEPTGPSWWTDIRLKPTERGARLYSPEPEAAEKKTSEEPKEVHIPIQRDTLSPVREDSTAPVPPTRYSRKSRSTGQLKSEDDRPSWLRSAKERRSLRTSNANDSCSYASSDRLSTASKEPEWVTRARKKLESLNVCLTSTDFNSASSQITESSSAWSSSLVALEDLRQETRRIGDELTAEASAKVSEELGLPDTSRMIEYESRSNDGVAERPRVTFHANASDRTETDSKRSRPRKNTKQRDEIRFGDLKHDWGGVQTSNAKSATGKQREMRFGEVTYSEANSGSKSEASNSTPVHFGDEVKQSVHATKIQSSTSTTASASYKYTPKPEMRFGDVPLDLAPKEIREAPLKQSSKFESIAGPDPTTMTADQLNQNVEEYDFPIPTGKEDATELMAFLEEKIKKSEVVPEVIMEDDDKPKPKSILKRRSTENVLHEVKKEESNESFRKPDHRKSSSFDWDSLAERANESDSDEEILEKPVDASTADASSKKSFVASYAMQMENSKSPLQAKKFRINLSEPSISSNASDITQNSSTVKSLPVTVVTPPPPSVKIGSTVTFTLENSEKSSECSEQPEVANRPVDSRREYLIKIEPPSSDSDNQVHSPVISESRRIRTRSASPTKSPSSAPFGSPEPFQKNIFMSSSLRSKARGRLVNDIMMNYANSQTNKGEVKKTFETCERNRLEADIDRVPVREAAKKFSVSEDSNNKSPYQKTSITEILDNSLLHHEREKEGKEKKTKVHVFKVTSNPPERQPHDSSNTDDVSSCDESKDVVREERMNITSNKKKNLIEWEALQRQRLDDDERNKINKNFSIKPVSSKIKELVKVHGSFISRVKKDNKEERKINEQNDNNSQKSNSENASDETSMKSPYIVKRVSTPSVDTSHNEKPKLQPETKSQVLRTPRIVKIERDSSNRKEEIEKPLPETVVQKSTREPTIENNEPSIKTQKALYHRTERSPSGKSRSPSPNEKKISPSVFPKSEIRLKKADVKEAPAKRIDEKETVDKLNLNSETRSKQSRSEWKPEVRRSSPVRKTAELKPAKKPDTLSKKPEESQKKHTPYKDNKTEHKTSDSLNVQEKSSKSDYSKRYASPQRREREKPSTITDRKSSHSAPPRRDDSSQQKRERGMMTSANDKRTKSASPADRNRKSSDHSRRGPVSLSSILSSDSSAPATPSTTPFSTPRATPDRLIFKDDKKSAPTKPLQKPSAKPQQVSQKDTQKDVKREVKKESNRLYIKRGEEKSKDFRTVSKPQPPTRPHATRRVTPDREATTNRGEKKSCSHACCNSSSGRDSRTPARRDKCREPRHHSSSPLVDRRGEQQAFSRTPHRKSLPKTYVRKEDSSRHNRHSSNKQNTVEKPSQLQRAWNTLIGKKDEKPEKKEDNHRSCTRHSKPSPSREPISTRRRSPEKSTSPTVHKPRKPNVSTEKPKKDPSQAPKKSEAQHKSQDTSRKPPPRLQPAKSIEETVDEWLKSMGIEQGARELTPPRKPATSSAKTTPSPQPSKPLEVKLPTPSSINKPSPPVEKASTPSPGRLLSPSCSTTPSSAGKLMSAKGKTADDSVFSTRLDRPFSPFSRTSSDRLSLRERSERVYSPTPSIDKPSSLSALLLRDIRPRRTSMGRDEDTNSRYSDLLNDGGSRDSSMDRESRVSSVNSRRSSFSEELESIQMKYKRDMERKLSGTRLDLFLERSISPSRGLEENSTIKEESDVDVLLPETPNNEPASEKPTDSNTNHLTQSTDRIVLSNSRLETEKQSLSKYTENKSSTSTELNISEKPHVPKRILNRPPHLPSLGGTSSDFNDSKNLKSPVESKSPTSLSVPNKPGTSIERRGSFKRNRPEAETETTTIKKEKVEISKSAEPLEESEVTVEDPDGNGWRKVRTTISRQPLQDGSTQKTTIVRTDSGRSEGGKTFQAAADRDLEVWAKASSVSGKLLSKEGSRFRHETEEEISSGGERKCKSVARKIVRRGSRRMSDGGEVINEKKETSTSGPTSQNNGTENGEASEPLLALPDGVSRKMKTSTDGERYMTQSVSQEGGRHTFTTQGVHNKTTNSVELLGGGDWEATRNIQGRTGHQLIVEKSSGKDGRHGTVVKKIVSQSRVIVTKTKRKTPVVV